MKPISPEQIPLPTALSRNLASRVVGLGVGMVVAMAPFLGSVKVPGFEALFNLLPFQIQSEIVAWSSFIVGLITVTLEFYVVERIPRRALRRIFKRVLIAILVGFVGFVVLVGVFTERVPRGKKKVSVMIGFTRTSSCRCTTPNNIECIQELSFDEAAIESCWGGGSLKVIKIVFVLWYLALMSGFVILVGLDLLRRAAMSQSRHPPAERKVVQPSVMDSAKAPLRRPGVAEPSPLGAEAPGLARCELERKRKEGVFDVFLCHNSADKPAVKRIGKQLEERGLLPWLDEWELPPGQPWQRLLEKQIGNIRSAAVFVGSAGVGPWQEEELYSFLREFVSRQCPVIPVLLPNAPEKPELPIFLRGMTWVDFRVTDPVPLDRLIWGITGKRPERLGE